MKDWLPTAISGLLITIAGWLFMRKYNKMEEDYLTEKTHKLLCEKAHLEFQKYVTDAVVDLKENYLEKKFRELIETIEKNGK